MAFPLHFLFLIAAFIRIQAEWIEIAQKSTPFSSEQKTKSSIRILKKSELDDLLSRENTTPSPHWVAYQRERFGQKQNTDSHKLVVTSENQMKNSAKVIVPANKGNASAETRPKNRIIKTTTRIDVVNDKPMQALEELPHIDPQTTTKRDMNHAGSEDYEYVEGVDDDAGVEHDQAQSSENTENVEEEISENEMLKPSWQGFIKFMKRIHQYWIKHAGLTISGKIKYLKKLRDKLMMKIEEQFDLIWPSGNSPRRSRERRFLLGESKINFPPEFALMSINFLTFAVFLIKLALQVVRLLKSKHYKISGLGLSAQSFMKSTIRN